MPGILLFANRRQNPDLAVLDLEYSLVWFTPVIPTLNAMKAFDRNFLHFVRDRMASVQSQTVDTASDQEVRAHLLREAEQLMDVALTVADMDAAPRII